MSDWWSYKRPALPRWAHWHMLGMLAWGFGVGFSIGPGVEHYVTATGQWAVGVVVGIGAFVIAFLLFMCGKYVAWREAQQSALPPDAP